MNVFASLIEPPAVRPHQSPTGRVHMLLTGTAESPTKPAHVVARTPGPTRSKVLGKRAIDDVLAVVRKAPTHSRSVATALGLGLNSVSSYLCVLKAQGFVSKTGMVRCASGRNMAVYEAVVPWPDREPNNFISKARRKS